MKKVLFTATVARFMKAFQIPCLKWFKEQGWETHVAALPEEGIGQLPYCDEFHSIPFTRSPLTASNVRAYKELKSLIDQSSFDIIHCHTPAGAALTRLAARSARKEGKSAVLYTAHGFHFYKGAPLANWLLYYPAEKLLSRWTDALITINKEDFARAQKRMHSKATYYIPGIGVDLQGIDSVSVDRAAKRAELGLPRDAKLLLSVGEMNKNKNHEVVLRALSKMDCSNVAYAICGRGPLEGYLRGLAESLGLKDKIFFLGFREDVIEICKAADVFVHPSIREGLPVALMEALACGLPAACSNIRGNVDLMEGAGLECLFSPKDEAAVRAVITRLLQDAAFARECAERNRQAVKAFSLEKSMQAMAGVYGAVMRQDAPAYNRKRQGGGHRHYLAFPLYPSFSNIKISSKAFKPGGNCAVCDFKDFELFASLGAAA